MKRFLVVDRFEDGFAVCLEGRRTRRVPASLLPSDAVEGSVIARSRGVYAVDAARTLRRRAQADRLTDEVFGK